MGQEGSLTASHCLYRILVSVNMKVHDQRLRAHTHNEGLLEP